MDKEIFHDTLQGLQDAVAYVRGDKTKGRSKIVCVPDVIPMKEYSKEDIKRIRNEHNMTLNVFSMVIGVSQKTVEAWETGTNKPTGSAKRLLQLIEEDYSVLEHMLVKS